MRAKNIANTVLGLNRNPLSGDKFASKSRNVKRERKLIPISEIDMHEDQPRSHSDQLKLERLMYSIKEEGLHHPIHVFWDTDTNKYRVVSGHRRLLAHIRLSYEEIEAEILPDKSSAKIAAVSINELSEQIHPIDKGVEVASLLSEKRFESISDIATYYGWSERTAYLYHSYVIIPEPVRELIVKSNLRNREFLNKIKEICSSIKDEDLSSHEIDKACLEVCSPLIIQEEKRKSLGESENSLKQKKKSNGVSSRISGVLYFEDGQVKVRSRVLAKLSDEDKTQVREAAQSIIKMLK